MTPAVIVAIAVGIFTSAGNVIVSILGLCRESRERKTYESGRSKEQRERADRLRHEIEAIEDRKRELDDLETEAKEVLRERADRLNAIDRKKKRKAQLIEDRFRETERTLPTVPLPASVGHLEYAKILERVAREKADALAELEEYVQAQIDTTEEEQRNANRALQRIARERERIRLTENRLRADIENPPGK